MAGIGFELRRLLGRDTYSGMAQAYGYGGVVSAGPWLISILVVLALGPLAAEGVPIDVIDAFQSTITKLLFGSLLLAGLVQLAFTRFVADRLFAADAKSIAPNLIGMLAIVIVASGIIAGTPALGGAGSTTARLLAVTGFVTLSGIWITTTILASLDRHLEVFGLYLIGYALTVAVALALQSHGYEGLLAGFVLGQIVLFAGALVLAVRAFPSDRFIRFDFLAADALHPSLIVGGVAFYAAILVDKIVLGAATAATWHLAYLAIVPGIAVYFVEIEARFAGAFRAYFGAVRGGATIRRIEACRDDMVATIRDAFASILRVQAIAVLIVCALAPTITDAMRLPDAAAPVLCVQVLGASLQVLFLAALTVFYYLDQRSIAALLAIECFVLNLFGSFIGLAIAPALAVWAFPVALIATLVTALVVLQRKLERLDFETFMLQSG